jgi:hypothetical protein
MVWVLYDIRHTSERSNARGYTVKKFVQQVQGNDPKVRRPQRQAPTLRQNTTKGNCVVVTILNMKHRMIQPYDFKNTLQIEMPIWA